MDFINAIFKTQTTELYKLSELVSNVIVQFMLTWTLLKLHKNTQNNKLHPIKYLEMWGKILVNTVIYFQGFVYCFYSDRICLLYPLIAYFLV